MDIYTAGIVFILVCLLYLYGKVRELKCNLVRRICSRMDYYIEWFISDGLFLLGLVAGSYLLLK